MSKINFFLGLSKKFNNICNLYLFSIEQAISEENFDNFIEILTLSQEDIEDSIYNYNDIVTIKKEDIPTPFDILLQRCIENQYYYELFKKAMLFFTKEKVTILFDLKQIWFCDLEQVLKEIKDSSELYNIHRIKESDYFDFQNLIRESIGQNKKDPYTIEENPKIRRLKAKARYRDRIKAKSGKGIDLDTNIAAICCMGIGLTPLNIGKISYSALRIISKMRQDKEKYETDIQSLLAGADSKKMKIEYWIKNLE